LGTELVELEQAAAGRAVGAWVGFTVAVAYYRGKDISTIYVLRFFDEPDKISGHRWQHLYVV
jgi:hypothetical protein